MDRNRSMNKMARPAVPGILKFGRKTSQEKTDYNQRQSVLEQSYQTGIVTMPDAGSMRAADQQAVSPVSEQSYSNDLRTAPMLQTSMEQDDRRQRRDSREIRQSPGASSQAEALIRENTKLRQEIEELRIESDQKQTAFEAMLDDVIRSEGLVEESKRVISARDTEIALLHTEVARLTSESQLQSPGPLTPSRDESKISERELRNLQLQCNRLKVEADRRNAQLHEAQEQLRLRDLTQSRTPAHGNSQDEVRDLRNQLATVSREAEEHHRAANSYYQQIHGWKHAYDELQKSHSELVQEAQTRESQPRIDEHTNLLRVEAECADKVRDAQQLSDFYKNNSEQVAKKNHTITAENNALQKTLYEKAKELDQYKILITTLQA